MPEDCETGIPPRTSSAGWEALSGRRVSPGTLMGPPVTETHGRGWAAGALDLETLDGAVSSALPAT